jgi:ribosomal protein S18 acetylase RimI-like enzyme
MTSIQTDFKAVTAQNFSKLKALVVEQARHHACDYTGDDLAFVTALERENPVAFSTLLHDESGNAVGYTFSNLFYGLDGPEVYLEDILVSRNRRANGFGLIMMHELKEEAVRRGANAVSWTVARNNPSAISFYKEKVGASPLHETVYDATHLLERAHRPSAEFAVRRAEAHDLDLVEFYAGRGAALTKERARNIRAAAAAPNAEVCVAYAKDVPCAVGVMNSHFSTFRTVYGYKLQMAEVIPSGDDRACAAFQATAAYAGERARATGHTGHLNIVAGNSSPAMNEFLRASRVRQLMMVDDNPESFLDLYGVSLNTAQENRLQRPAAGR